MPMCLRVCMMLLAKRLCVLTLTSVSLEYIKTVCDTSEKTNEAQC